MLNVEEVRARVENDFDDATLQTIIDAELQALERAAGKSDAVQTTLAAGLRMFTLTRKSSSITSITERRTHDSDPLTLDPDDYRLIGNYRLMRNADGTNPASTWGAEVVVSFTAEVDADLRDRVLMDLIQMSVEFRAFETEEIGDSKREENEDTYKKRRQTLLNQISEGRGTIV